MDSLLLSIVIPTYNRFDLLALLLNSIKSIENKKSFEIIVVHDGDDHGQLNILLNQYSGLPVQGYVLSHGFVARARNFGANKAKGDYLAFIDDDVELDAQWFRGFYDIISKNNSRILEGKVLPMAGELNPLLYTVKNIEGGSYLTCNLIFKKESFFALKGFDELCWNHEDPELSIRAKREYTIPFAEKIIVYHSLRKENLVQNIFRAYKRFWIFVISEYRLYFLHPLDYGRVRFHSNPFKTLIKLSFFYFISAGRGKYSFKFPIKSFALFLSLLWAQLFIFFYTLILWAYPHKPFQSMLDKQNG